MIIQRIKHVVAANHVLLKNAGSMVGTTLVTSALGFAYWWLAARQFPPEAVGLASAAVSAMMLLATISVLGLGTLLIGELPRHMDRQASLITTALLFVAVLGSAIGFLFVAVAPQFIADLRPLSESLEAAAIFALGVCLTAVTMVLDQAMIGLLRGGFQLGRNALFAVAKLGILFIVSRGLIDAGLTIYAAWALGNALSLIVLGVFALTRGVRIDACRPQWGLLRKLGRVALGHHALNLALQAPTLALPVLVTALLSAHMNGFFYSAWMMAMFVFSGPLALTTVLYAIGRADPTVVAYKIRSTLRLSILAGVLANVVLLAGADSVLHLFGEAYAANAGWSLRLLGLGVFPIIIKNHYIAICRIRGRVTQAALTLAATGLIDLVLAGLGARLGGLTGLTAGYLAGLCLEAAFMSRRVHRAAFPTRSRSDEPVADQTSSVPVPARSATP